MADTDAERNASSLGRSGESDSSRPRRLKPWCLACLLVIQFLAIGLWLSMVVCAIHEHYLSWLGIGVAIIYIGVLIYPVFSLSRRGLKKPGRRRILVTIAACVLIIGLFLAWMFRPEYGQWRPYTFDDQLSAIEAERQIPDNENAAHAYEPLFASKDANTPIWKLFSDSSFHPWSQPWNETEHPEFSKYLRQHENTLTQLRRIAKFDQCRFPISARSLAALPGRCTPIANSLALLSASANADLGVGRLDEALDKFTVVFRITRQLRQQWQLFDYLQGLGCERSVYASICTFVLDADLTDEQLRALDEFVARDNSVEGQLRGVVRTAQLHTSNLFGLLYEVGPGGRTRFSRHFSQSLTLTGLDIEPDPPLQQKALAIIIAMSAPYYPRTAGRVIKDAYAAYGPLEASKFHLAEVDACEKACESRMRQLGGVLTLAFCVCAEDAGTAFRRTLDHLAFKRAARIVVQARVLKNAHGKWPETLNEMAAQLPPETFVDPYYGGRLAYLPTPDSIYIYSTGADGVDQGDIRKYLSKGEDGSSCDDRPIWPTRSQIRRRVDAMADANQPQ